MDKRYYKEVFRVFNFGHTITIHKGKLFYIGCVDTYRVTGFCESQDECLDKCRIILENMPEWLKTAIG